VGWISQAASPRVALAVGGSATVVASAITRHHHRRQHMRDEAAASEAGLAPGEVVEEAEPGTELGVA